MPRWLPGLFGGARAAQLETKADSDRRASMGNFYVAKGMPYVSNWDVDRAVRDGYEKVIWVFKAIDANAEKLSSWPIRCYEGDRWDPERKSVDDDILPLLNAKANTIDGPAKFFRYRLVSQLLLSKQGVFIEAIPNRTGTAVAALNLLPPGRTQPLPDPDTFISGFRVTLGDGEIFDPSNAPGMRPYDPKTHRGVIWIRKPHPTDPYSGITPLEAAGISIDLDFYARLYNRNFLLNDGRAGQIVAVKGGLSDDDAMELKARFSPGLQGVGRTTVIEADAINVSDTAVTPRDAQYAELRSLTKEDLLIALGTPESCIGNASGRTFDNADAEKENWLEDTVVPLGGVIESGFEMLTEGGWEDDRFFEHDYSREPVLQRVKNARIKQAAEDYDDGRITLAEYRQIAEKDPINAPGADVLWLNINGKAPTSEDPEKTAEAAALTIMQPQPPAMPGMPPDGGQPADPNAPNLFDGGGGAADPNAADPNAPSGDGSAPGGDPYAGTGDPTDPFSMAANASGYGAYGYKSGFALELKADWFADDVDEPFEVKAISKPHVPASFDWDENKVKRDEHGRFAKVAGKLAHILDYPADYPWAKVEGAPPATALPAPKKIKTGSLRKGDVIAESGEHGSPTWTVAGIGKPTTPPKVGEANGAKIAVTVVNTKGDKKTIIAPNKDTAAWAVARTPHPAAVAAAKKDKAAAATPGPKVTGLAASQIKVGDVMVDGNGEQWEVSSVIPEGGDMLIYGNPSDGSGAHADQGGQLLGSFKASQAVTIKGSPPAGSEPAGYDPPAAWNSINPSPYAGAYKYQTTDGQTRILKVGEAGYGSLYNESGDHMVTYKPDEIEGVVLNLPPSYSHDANINAFDASVPAEPDLGGQPSAVAGVYHHGTVPQLDTLVVHPDGSGTMTPFGEAPQSLSPKLVQSNLLGGSWSKQSDGPKQGTGKLTGDGFPIHIASDGSMLAAGPGTVWMKPTPNAGDYTMTINPDATATVKGSASTFTLSAQEAADELTGQWGAWTKVDAQQGAAPKPAGGRPQKGRYVHSNGQILTVNEDGSGLHVTAKGKVTHLTPDQVHETLGKPGWSKATVDEAATAPSSELGAAADAELMANAGITPDVHMNGIVQPGQVWHIEDENGEHDENGDPFINVLQILPSGHGWLTYGDAVSGDQEIPNPQAFLDNSSSAELIAGPSAGGGDPTSKPISELVAGDVVQMGGATATITSVENWADSDGDTTMVYGHVTSGIWQEVQPETDASGGNMLYMGGANETLSLATPPSASKPLATGVTKKAAELHLGDTIDVADQPVTVTSVGPSHEPGGAGYLAIFGKPIASDTDIPGADHNITDVYGGYVVATTHPEYEFPTYAAAAPTPDLDVPDAASYKVDTSQTGVGTWMNNAGDTLTISETGDAKLGMPDGNQGHADQGAALAFISGVDVVKTHVAGGVAVGTWVNSTDAVKLVVKPDGTADLYSYPDTDSTPAWDGPSPPGTTVTTIDPVSIPSYTADMIYIPDSAPLAGGPVDLPPAKSSSGNAMADLGAFPGDVFWQTYTDGSVSKYVVVEDGSVQQRDWSPWEWAAGGKGKLAAGGHFYPENFGKPLGGKALVKSPYPPPPQHSKVYIHPQGKVIYVTPSGGMQVWGPDGKKKTSSATPDNLAWGHGDWTQVYSIPGWEESTDDEWVPSATSAPATPDAPDTHYDMPDAPTPPVGGDTVYVTSPTATATDTQPNVLTVHPDGSATFYNAISKDTAAISAPQVQELLGATTGAPNQESFIWTPAAGQVFVDQYGNHMTVSADGSGTISYANGTSNPLHLEATDVSNLLSLTAVSPEGSWKHADTSGGVAPATYAQTAGTGSELNQLGNTPADLLAAATPEQKQLLALLDYPADYPWPQAPGLVPATTKPASGTVKVNSLRNGDVVNLGPGGGLGFAKYPASTPMTLTKIKPNAGNASWQLTGVLSDGTQVSVGVGITDIPVLARTPHPSKVAAAKKLKKQLLEGGGPAANQAYTSVGVPGPKASGVYTSPGGILAITVDEQGHAAWTSTGGQSLGNLQGPNEILGGPVGADFTFVPAGAAAAPNMTGFVATGPVLSESAKAAAKPKWIHSAVIKNGGTVLLPLGGSMLVSEAKYVPSKPKPGGGYRPGGYVLIGTPSADINPIYLSGDNQATYNVTIGGTNYLPWIPKAVLNKKGATIKGAPVVQAPTPAPTPTAKPAGHVANPGINGPVSTAGWTKVGPQGGSNPGGVFQAPDGTKYYVKAPKTPTHVENEVLAAKLYTAAGIAIPSVSQVPIAPELKLPATVGVASQIVEGKKNLAAAHTDPAYRAKIVDGFAVDAWLANWDAAGTGKDNIIQLPNGDPLRVDVGGSLLFRAQGEPKGVAFGPTVGEVKTLAGGPGNKMPDAGDVFGKVSKAELKASVEKHIAPITEAQIDALVDSTMTSLSAGERTTLKATLKARRKDIAKQAGVVLPEDKPKPKTPTVDVSAGGGTALPYKPGLQITHDQVTLEGKDLWWHTTLIGATQVGPGNVVFLDDDASAPYVVTKIAEKVQGAPSPKGGVVSDGGIGKMGVWGKRNGTGPEVFMFVQTTSQGERKVHVQIEPPPGWAPPPPPPPPTPGVKLQLPDMTGNHAATPGATSLLQQINNSSSRTAQLKKAWKLATPEQHAALAAVKLDDPDAFAQHFGDGLASSWDGSSNNGTSLLAFHHAIAIEFGLDDVAPWGAEQKNMKTKQAVAQYFAKYGAAYQAGARLIYQNTQNELKAKGIKYVKITRTMQFQPPPTSGGYGTPAPPWAWTNGVHTDVTLRPISSFSWGVKNFGNTKVQAVVPVEMIFSINSTGPGTDYEQEIVPLGVAHYPWQVSGAVSPSSGYTKAQYLKDYPEWNPGTSTLAPGIKSWFDDTPGAYDHLPAGPFPNDLTEDWLKGTFWPFVDADGDDVISISELLDLYPDVVPWSLLDLPVGAAMPPALRDELLSADVDDDDIGPFASDYLPSMRRPADEPAAPPEVKAEPSGWVGM